MLPVGKSVVLREEKAGNSLAMFLTEQNFRSVFLLPRCCRVILQQRTWQRSSRPEYCVALHSGSFYFHPWIWEFH